MTKYIIGIIDEDKADVDNIIRTIMLNKPEDIEEAQIQFTPFQTDILSNAFDESIQRFLSEIEEMKITGLIIDYKIMENSVCIKGTEILNRLEDVVAKFPLIILSNLPNDCYHELVDADKVYSKQLFFKIEEQYSHEKTLNIFRNMDHYLEMRSKLKLQYLQSIERMKHEGTTAQVIAAIVETEKKLADYLPQHQTESEKMLDIADLKNAIQLLREADELLGGTSEN